MDRDASIAGEEQRNLDYTRCYWHLRGAGALVSAVLLEVLSQFSGHLPQTKEIRRKLSIVFNIFLVVLADFIKSEYIFHS